MSTNDYLKICNNPISIVPPEQIPEKVLEEKFGKKSMFHPMCCITARFIDEGYSLGDLVQLYKELVKNLK